MQQVIIITLDGPAGVGKSSLARQLAGKLKLAFLDTGSMFRILACGLGEPAFALSADALVRALASIRFSLEGTGDSSVLLYNGKAPGDEIRTEQIGALASRFATLPEVRSFLKSAQQRIGAETSLVAEGRDLGTVIFPGAFCKFFVDADPHVRALRRQKQLAEQGRVENLAELEARIIERDAQDRNRAIAPLRPAEDAVIVDTSSLTLEQVLEILLGHVRMKGF